jgi:DNA repair exonuclease SbcCD nuclease subunit
MKYLFVGDIHAVPEELDDCARLMDLVDETAKAENVDATVFMGDQHHTHNIIRAEVMDFYRARFKKPGRRMTLVGNHDYAGEGNLIHAMQMYEDLVKVVDHPSAFACVLFMPYMADREKFVEICNKYSGANTLVCHQTFVGSRYENGFLAEDGIDLSRIPQQNIISGHIHTPQNFDRVTYIGAPRWRNLSDANIDRAIWLYDFDISGNVREKRSIDTGKVCRQIRYVSIKPDDLFFPDTEDGELDPNVDWRIDITGPADFVTAQKKLWARPGVKVRTFLTDRQTARVRESEGIGNAFKRFLKDYKPKNGTPVEVLEQMARERLSV